MPNPNPNYGQWAATTIANYSPEIADNVSAHNALFTQMKKRKGITITGGSPIIESINWQQNPNGGSYSGFDILGTAADDGPTAAQFNLAQYAVPVAFSGLDSLVNNGKEAILDLLEAKLETASDTMANLLNQHTYLDGTGNNGRNILGLGAALPAVVPASQTNSYGGIDRSVSTNSFWRSQYSTATTLVGAAATATTIQQAWNAFVIQMTRGGDRPDLIVCAPSVFAIFESSLQALQRFDQSDLANAGFRALKFQGIDVVFDTSASGITGTYAYFLNTKYLKLRTHAKRNFVAKPQVDSINQDATVQQLLWAGNLTCNGAQFNGLFNNV